MAGEKLRWVYVVAPQTDANTANWEKHWERINSYRSCIGEFIVNCLSNWSQNVQLILCFIVSAGSSGSCPKRPKRPGKQYGIWQLIVSLLAVGYGIISQTGFVSWFQWPMFWCTVLLSFHKTQQHARICDDVHPCISFSRPVGSTQDPWHRKRFREAEIGKSKTQKLLRSRNWVRARALWE